MSVAEATDFAIPAHTATSRLRAVFGGSVGNLVEWYDWFAYSSFALYFAKAFFPAGSQTMQLLNAAAVFAVGFLVRPIGSWLMGIYCDRSGRRAALVISMGIMGIGSLGIALTPSYSSIGVFAPILLVLARIAQGLSIGGEYATSATYLTEVADRKHRGFWGSFQYLTMIMGQLIALMVLIVLQHVMSAEALGDWGWRIPFFGGAALAFGALFIMLGLEETRSFEAVKRKGVKIDSWKLMAAHPRELLTVLGITMAGSLGFYTFSTYIQKFLVNTSGFTKEAATSITAGTMVVFMLMQPVMGAISDKVGRRPMIMFFGGVTMLTTPPLMTGLAGTQNALLAFALVSLIVTIQSTYTSISGVFKAELFPTEIRALGVGLPFAIGNSLVGGTAEFVALSFKAEGHESWFFWYVSGFMALAFITATLAPDSQKHSKILED